MDWIYGLSSSIVFTSDADFNTIVVIVAFKFPTQVRTSCASTIVSHTCGELEQVMYSPECRLFAFFFTLVVPRQPHELHQSVYSHLQTLTNYADE